MSASCRHNLPAAIAFQSTSGLLCAHVHRHAPRVCKDLFTTRELNWTNLHKLTQLHDAFIGHARRRRDYTSYNAKRRAESPAAVFSAARDDDFLDFSCDDKCFHQHFRFPIYNDDDRALHDLSADSTMTSPLLCDTAYLSVSWVESLCDLFLPVVQSQALENFWSRAI